MSAETREARRYQRLPLSIEVQYRTSGSFLVDYSINLSKGGVFIATDELLAVGSRLTIRFCVPGLAQAVETPASVVWIREHAEGPQCPKGVGVAFDRLDRQIGSTIDALVRGFRGLTFYLVAGAPPIRARIKRFLQSTLRCEVKDQSVQDWDDAFASIESGTERAPDLVVVDHPSTRSAGVEIVRRLGTLTQSVPVVVVVASSEASSLFVHLGAAATVDVPVTFERLRGAVLEVLARPLTAGERAR